MPHTPGPWIHVPEKLLNGGHVAGRGPSIRAEGIEIAKVHHAAPTVPKQHGFSYEAEGNAALMAESPAMLQALRWIVEDIFPEYLRDHPEYRAVAEATAVLGRLEGL